MESKESSEFLVPLIYAVKILSVEEFNSDVELSKYMFKSIEKSTKFWLYLDKTKLMTNALIPICGSWIDVFNTFMWYFHLCYNIIHYDNWTHRVINFTCVSTVRGSGARLIAALMRSVAFDGKY